jgi:hypothetical protein
MNSSLEVEKQTSRVSIPVPEPLTQHPADFPIVDFSEAGGTFPQPVLSTGAGCVNISSAAVTGEQVKAL